DREIERIVDERDGVEKVISGWKSQVLVVAHRTWRQATGKQRRERRRRLLAEQAAGRHQRDRDRHGSAERLACLDQQTAEQVRSPSGRSTKLEAVEREPIAEAAAAREERELVD